MYKLELLHHFSAAHKLEDYIGACSNLHGHNWDLKIVIKTTELFKDMIIDFKDIKKAIDERYDHKYINEQVNFNPTAENISKDIFGLVRELYYRKSEAGQDKAEAKITVTVWESNGASITYSE